MEKRLLLLQLAELYWVDYGWLAHGDSHWEINAMVIDNQAASRTVSSLILKNILGDKLTVHEFSCGETALAWTEKHYAQFILCDYALSGENTVDIISQLHEQFDYQTIPIAILTSDTSDEIQSNCLDAGAQAIIPKALEIETLPHVCQQYLPAIFDTGHVTCH